MHTLPVRRLFGSQHAERLRMALVLAGVLLLPRAPVANAANIVVNANIIVNATNDELNGDGDRSLREAIQAARTESAVEGCMAGSGSDTITLPAGSYQLTLAEH